MRLVYLRWLAQPSKSTNGIACVAVVFFPRARAAHRARARKERKKTVFFFFSLFALHVPPALSERKRLLRRPQVGEHLFPAFLFHAVSHPRRPRSTRARLDGQKSSQRDRKTRVKRVLRLSSKVSPVVACGAGGIWYYTPVSNIPRLKNA